ncbi:MAG: hypothetical protein JSR76_01070 [Verrucomicrobia bacterium]|nr:hypothetical protein [Verrucomicrobiota bacterium]
MKDRVPISKKKSRAFQSILDRLLLEGMITKEEEVNLSSKIVVEKFDWRRFARYAFIIASLCFIFGLYALIDDRRFLEVFSYFFMGFEKARIVFLAGLVTACNNL